MSVPGSSVNSRRFASAAAAPPAKVRVLRDQTPSLGDGGPHAADQAARLAQVLEQESRIHGLIGAGRSPVSDISRGELDVAESALCRLLPGQGEFDLVHVDADYCPARATSQAMSIVTSPPPHPMSMQSSGRAVYHRGVGRY